MWSRKKGLIRGQLHLHGSPTVPYMESAKDPLRIVGFWGEMLKKRVIYRCGTDFSPDDRDDFRCLRITSAYSSETTRSETETPPDTSGQRRDTSRNHKDTSDGYTDLAETHGWGLRIFISLADVSLSIGIFYYHNITPVSMGGVDHWISGCQ